MQTQATSAEAGAQTGELIEKAKHDVGELASEAREQVEDAAENVLDSVANQLEDFAAQIRKQDLASIFEHVQNAAKHSPGLFFAGSVATGLALARFMKASEHHEGRDQADMRGDVERGLAESRRQPRQAPPAPMAKPLHTASSPSTPLPNLSNPRS
jgi:hypothetical protein